MPKPKVLNPGLIRPVQRLSRYLTEVHLAGRACVFYELSGHVDWLEIRIAESKEDYLTDLYTNAIYLYADTSAKKLNAIVDVVISEVEAALLDRAQKVAQQAAAAEARRREQYEKLKVEFETSSRDTDLS